MTQICAHPPLALAQDSPARDDVTVSEGIVGGPHGAEAVYDSDCYVWRVLNARGYTILI